MGLGSEGGGPSKGTGRGGVPRSTLGETGGGLPDLGRIRDPTSVGRASRAVLVVRESVVTPSPRFHPKVGSPV